MMMTVTNLLHRVCKCPFACFLKFLLAVGLGYVLHIALYHQADMSPYVSALLVVSLCLVAVLALAFHSTCDFSRVEKHAGTD